MPSLCTVWIFISSFNLRNLDVISALQVQIKLVILVITVLIVITDTIITAREM